MEARTGDAPERAGSVPGQLAQPRDHRRLTAAVDADDGDTPGRLHLMSRVHQYPSRSRSRMAPVMSGGAAPPSSSIHPSSDDSSLSTSWDRCWKSTKAASPSPYPLS